MLDGATPFTLQIGIASPALQSCHWRFGVDSSVFITACNPWSVRRDEAGNQAAQAALQRALALRRLATLPGISRDPQGVWPEEPSLLVLGLGEPGARELGQGFQQNAVVMAGADAIPRLVLLR